jgi:ABC-type transport system substrate-binding protein
MRDAANPTALMIPPQVNGYAPDLAKRLPFDVEAAKKLMAEAGYPNGFELKMNCPNDRYVNDGRNLPGGGRQPVAYRRENQPGSRDQGHLLPQDLAP